VDINDSLLRCDFNEILKTEMIINDNSLSKLNMIKTEWEKFIKGKQIDTNIVPRQIHESWQRSMDYGIDPYSLKKSFLSPDTIREQLRNSENLVHKFGDIITYIQYVSRKKGLTVQLFDRQANNFQIIAVANYFHRELGISNTIPTHLSEEDIGTNAICVALREKKAVQVLGPQHFCRDLHNIYCSAAPIHNSNGEIIGAILIYSYNKKHTIDILMLVTLLAKIFDNISFMTEALDELQGYKSAISSTVEHFPQGMAYINQQNKISCYNSKFISMLNINKNNIKPELDRFMSHLQHSNYSGHFEDKKINLNVHGAPKHFLISVKPGKLPEEKIIMLKNLAKLNKTHHGHEATFTFEDIISQDAKTNKVIETAKKVAKTSSAILLFGESGTGKELFAQAIHNASSRKNHPFVAINCGAIPSELVESELFGYEPGAFTGALKEGKLGKLEIAYGGTLFLDEIESMPLHTQVKLLRALSVNKICRVGGVKEIPINPRLISATKKDLLQESDAGKFRDDLYYRISTITLTLPPLRDRIEDVPLLVSHFIDKFSKEFNLGDINMQKDFLDALSHYHWRGNIRELNNVIEGSVALLDDERELTLNHLPEKIIKAYNYKSLKSKLCVIKNKQPGTPNLIRLGEEIVIDLLLQEESGNLSKVASRIGVSRQTIYNKISNNEKLRKKFDKITKQNPKPGNSDHAKK